MRRAGLRRRKAVEDGRRWRRGKGAESRRRWWRRIVCHRELGGWISIRGRSGLVMLIAAVLHGALSV